MDEYLEDLRASDKNTDYIRQVRSGLHHFAEFLRGEGVLSPEEITRMHLVRFQAHCNERVASGEWKKSYSIQMIKKVRAWINWLDDVGYITTNPWQAIRVGTVKKQPKPLEDGDVEILFEAHRRTAFQTDPFIFHRREVILTLLYAWGLRIHELEALNVSNMDMRLDRVTARNKGGGTKREPYTPQIKQIVSRWLNQRVKHAEHGEDALLITTAGTRLSKEQIREIVTDLGKSCGVKINPHRLRDTCGTHLLDSDVPAERVQQILGHSDLKQTLAYSRVNEKKVFESLQDAMDPRLNLLLFGNTRDLEPIGD
jgi:integrase/recombinase XerC